MVFIIGFEDKYAADFKKLNLEWLDKYHLTESHDLEVLDDPTGTVIDRGGYIYLAMYEGEVIGTAALVKEPDDEFELAKMAVAPAFQGKGISKLLIEKCIDQARQKGARKLFLYSNSQLKKALQLYTRYGFKQVPVINSPFLTADVKMEFQF
jgi:GNAT superfamily N-acetyltransferase